MRISHGAVDSVSATMMISGAIAIIVGFVMLFITSMVSGGIVLMSIGAAFEFIGFVMYSR